MKTVHGVEFDCNFSSEPLADELAEQLRQKLEAKGISCYTRAVEEQPVSMLQNYVLLGTSLLDTGRVKARMPFKPMFFPAKDKAMASTIVKQMRSDWSSLGDVQLLRIAEKVELRL